MQRQLVCLSLCKGSIVPVDNLGLLWPDLAVPVAVVPVPAVVESCHFRPAFHFATSSATPH